MLSQEQHMPRRHPDYRHPEKQTNVDYKHINIEGSRYPLHRGTTRRGYTLWYANCRSNLFEPVRGICVEDCPWRRDIQVYSYGADMTDVCAGDVVYILDPRIRRVSQTVTHHLLEFVTVGGTCWTENHRHWGYVVDARIAPSHKIYDRHEAYYHPVQGVIPIGRGFVHDQISILQKHFR